MISLNDDVIQRIVGGDMVIVFLTVNRWRGKAKTSFRELGLDETVYRKAFTAGSHRLLPKELEQELTAIESLVRKIVSDRTIETPVGRLAARDTWAKIDSLLSGPLATLRSEATSSRATRYEHWNSISARDRWTQIGQLIADNRQAFIDQISHLYEPVLADQCKRLGYNEEQSAAFRANRLALLERAIPADVADRFGIYFSAVSIEALAVMQAQLDYKQVQMLLTDAEQKQAMADDMMSRAKQMLTEADEQSKALVRQTVEGTIAELQRTAAEVIDSIYGPMLETVLDGLKQIDNGDSVHARWVMRLNRTLDSMERLPDFGDKRVGQMVKELRSLAASKPASKNNASVTRKTLKDVGSRAAAIMQDYGRANSLADLDLTVLAPAVGEAFASRPVLEKEPEFSLDDVDVQSRM